MPRGSLVLFLFSFMCLFFHTWALQVDCLDSKTLCQLPDVWSWVRYLIPIRLSFLVYKMGTIIVATSYSYVVKMRQGTSRLNKGLLHISCGLPVGIQEWTRYSPCVGEGHSPDRHRKVNQAKHRGLWGQRVPTQPSWGNEKSRRASWKMWHLSWVLQGGLVFSLYLSWPLPTSPLPLEPHVVPHVPRWNERGTEGPRKKDN